MGWSEADNNATAWLHLASWNLPDSQLRESKMEPRVEKISRKNFRNIYRNIFGKIQGEGETTDKDVSIKGQLKVSQKSNGRGGNRTY